MGYAWYEIDGMERGYAVDDTCHASDCQARIDRGLVHLCYRCTRYFCGQHLVLSEAKHDCFAGQSEQTCISCDSAV